MVAAGTRQVGSPEEVGSVEDAAAVLAPVGSTLAAAALLRGQWEVPKTSQGDVAYPMRPEWRRCRVAPWRVTCGLDRTTREGVLYLSS